MSPTQSSNYRLFQKLSITTVIAVYLLILVGGVVRSTGSGMGCPDWPKCFGSWVPPTEVSQLPSDYKDVYSQQRVQKNSRLASYLEKLGFAELAYQVEHDESIKEEADFNATKTWIEYVNRLIGAIIGLLVFATFVASLRLWKTDPVLTITSFSAVILVGFQGWVGSLVVSTNLLPGMITFHMLLALLIVCLLIYVAYRAKSSVNSSRWKLKDSWPASGLVIFLLLLTLAQIALGTQVRESVDMVAKTLGEENRQGWIDALGSVFTVHRSLSFLVVAMHVIVAALIYQRFGVSGNLTKWSLVLVVVIGLEVASGVIMAYFNIPRVAQPIHLLFATVAFGIQFYLLLGLISGSGSVDKYTQESQQYVSY
ncbi:MAG: heme A synthase [Cyclobacteriaceae bacterium]